MSIKRFVSALRRDEAGAAMFEFALVAGLVFIPLVFGIIEFGRLTWAKNMVTAAAREGTRYAVVHGSDALTVADSAAVANYVIGRTKIRPITVKPAWPGGNDPTDTVTVTVTYVYSPVVKGIVGSKTIRGISKQLISN